MVAIFWDYENCRLPTNVAGYNVVNHLRAVAHTFGTIRMFKAYLDVSEDGSSRTRQLRSELQLAGVSLIDCPHNGRKEVVDKAIIVDMLTYAMDHPPPETMVLVSGDRDFAHVLSILRLRQYQVLILAPTLPSPHISLRCQASLFLDWNVEILSKAASDNLQESPRQASIPSSVTILPCLNSTPIRPSVEKADRDSEWIPVQSAMSCEVPVGIGSPDQRTIVGDLGLFGGSDDGGPDLVSRDKIEHSWTGGVRKSILSLLGQSPSAAAYEVDPDKGWTWVENPYHKRLEPQAVEPNTPHQTSIAVTPSPSRSSPSLAPQSANTSPSTHFGLDHDDHTHETSVDSTLTLTMSLPLRSGKAPDPPVSPAPRNGGGASNSNPPTISEVVIKSSPPSPASEPPSSPTTTSNQPAVPKLFVALVGLLREEHAKGNVYIRRSLVAETLCKRDPGVYRRAGVTTFRSYTNKAKDAGLVVLNNDWMSLHSKWL